MGKEKARVLKPVAPMADVKGWMAKVCYERPENNWIEREFNDAKWATQQAAFGTPGEYLNINTRWTKENSDIYIVAILY